MIGGCMGDAKRGPLADTPVPTVAPSIPEDVVDDVLAALSGHVEAVFLPWIADRFSVEWLDVNDDRLGMTRFEEGSNELIDVVADSTWRSHHRLASCSARGRGALSPHVCPRIVPCRRAHAPHRTSRPADQSGGTVPCDEGFTAVAKDEVGRVGCSEGAGVDLPTLRLQVEADHGASPYTLLEVRTALVSWHTLQVWSARPKAGRVV